MERIMIKKEHTHTHTSPFLFLSPHPPRGGPLVPWSPRGGFRGRTQGGRRSGRWRAGGGGLGSGRCHRVAGAAAAPPPLPLPPSPPPPILLPAPAAAAPGAAGGAAAQPLSRRRRAAGPSAGVSDRRPGRWGLRGERAGGRGRGLQGCWASRVVPPRAARGLGQCAPCEAVPERGGRGRREGPPPGAARAAEWGTGPPAAGLGAGVPVRRRLSLLPANVRLGCKSCRLCFSGQRPRGDGGGTEDRQ